MHDPDLGHVRMEHNTVIVAEGFEGTRDLIGSDAEPVSQLEAGGSEAAVHHMANQGVVQAGHG